MSCCASCGIAEGDGIQLKKCNGCYLVRYCGVTCQRNHRPKHKKSCKKRAAELRDEILFRQPESTHLGDCPICLLPLPYPRGSIYHSCCSKLVCKGCAVANFRRLKEERLEHTCPFCRDVTGKNGHNQKMMKRVQEEMMKRVQANDPSAMCHMGVVQYEEGNHVEALQYYSKAAKLGDVTAHYNASCMYNAGEGAEKDDKKRLHHLEEAAIGGHPGARYNLAHSEASRGRKDRALKHLIIAANLGDDKSIQLLKKFYADGHMSKEDFASALRAHKAAVDATKSPQRDVAEAV